jgi:AcrR family transcriptional regulator
MSKQLKKELVESEGTRETLIRHALKLVSEIGYDAVSLREVARSAELSHMAPYKHFKDKEALFAAVVVHGFNSLSERFLKIERTSLAPEDRFMKMGETYIHFAIENPEQFRLMFSGFLKKSEDHPSVKEASDACFSYLVRLIEYCQFHSFLKRAPVEEVSSFIWSQIHGFSSLWIEGCFEKVEKNLTKKNLEKFIHHQVKTMVKAL